MAVDAFDRWPLDVGNATAQDAPESLEIPLAFVPPFARKLGALASENGFAQAVTEVLADANITVEYNGDLFDGSFSADKEQGLIIASNHGHCLEPILVQAAMHKADRDASAVLAMPVSLPGRIMQSTKQGQELIITTVPTFWAAERKLPLTKPRNILRRSLHPKALNRPIADLQCVNGRAMTRAAEVVSAAGTVTLAPSGGPLHNVNLPWQKGIARIIGKLSEETRTTTQIAAFEAVGQSTEGLLASLLLRDMGIHPRKRTVVLNAKVLGTVGKICGQHINTGEQQVANAVRDVCIANLPLHIA